MDPFGCGFEALAWSGRKRMNHLPQETANRRRRFFVAWMGAVILTLGGLVVLRLVSPFHFETGFVARLVLYVAWALVQQFLVTRLVIDRISRGSIACLVGSLVFSLIHLPNMVLVGLTLLFGLFAYPLYRRTGLMLPIALSHAVLGTCLDKFTDLSLRVWGL